MSDLTAARAAKLHTLMNRWHRDSRTKAIYTHARRLEAGEYLYRVVELEAGKPNGYGAVLAVELEGELSYMTPVVPVPKMVYDAMALPTLELSHDTFTAVVR